MNLEKALSLIIEKIVVWTEEIIKMLPNLIVASIILIVGLTVVSRLKNKLQPYLRKKLPTQILADLTTSIFHLVLAGVIILSALKILNLDRAVTTALAGAGIIGLALAFAFQDIAANYISGVLLSISRPFRIGELIQVNGYEGFVKELKLRETLILTYQGQYISIPNKEVFQNPITNYTRLGKRRADITGGVRKENDLKFVQSVALEALKKVPNVIQEDTTFLFEEISNDTMNFKIRIWVNSGKFNDYLQFINDVIVTLDVAFKDNDITVPDDNTIIKFDLENAEQTTDVVMARHSG